MATLLEIRRNKLSEKTRAGWLEYIKHVTAEQMEMEPYNEVVVFFHPCPPEGKVEREGSTLFLRGDWACMFGERYTDKACGLLASDGFFSGWRISKHFSEGVPYLVMTTMIPETKVEI